MRHPLLFPVFILGLFLLEIYGFAWMGSAIGALPTVLLVVLSAGLGFWMFGRQGGRQWQRMRQQLASGEGLSVAWVEGPLLLLAALLLLLPGFFSDGIGLLLLIPGLRHVLAQRLWLRMVSRFAQSRPGTADAPRAATTLEGEFRPHAPERLPDRKEN